MKHFGFFTVRVKRVCMLIIGETLLRAVRLQMMANECVSFQFMPTAKPNAANITSMATANQSRSRLSFKDK